MTVIAYSSSMLDDYVPLAHGHTFVTVTSAPVNGAMSDVERVTHEKEVLSLAKKAESAEKLLLRQKLDVSKAVK